MCTFHLGRISHNGTVKSLWPGGYIFMLWALAGLDRMLCGRIAYGIDPDKRWLLYWFSAPLSLQRAKRILTSMNRPSALKSECGGRKACGGEKGWKDNSDPEQEWCGGRMLMCCRLHAPSRDVVLPSCHKSFVTRAPHHTHLLMNRLRPRNLILLLPTH